MLDFIMACSITMIFGIVMFSNGFRAMRMRKEVQITPTSKIGGLAMGPVEIDGTVTAPMFNALQKSPITEEECVYYKYLVEERKETLKKQSSRWISLASGRYSTGMFYVDDGTGVVLVNSKFAHMDIEPSVDFVTNIFRGVPKNLLIFLEKKGIKTKNFIGMNKKIRIREWVLRKGDKVFISGNAVDNPHVDETWAVKGGENIMIDRGKDGLHINNSEKNMMRGLLRKMILGLVGGSLLILLGLSLLLVVFGGLLD